MNATAVATQGGIRVQVPAALASKAQYLEVLVAKIKNAATSAFRKAMTFLRRVWSAIPAAVARNAKAASTVAAAVASTRAGYTALTGFVRSALQFVTKNWNRIENALHVAIDKVGIFLASVVARINKKAGAVLSDLNSKFTDVRWSLISRTRSAFAGFGNMLNSAFNADTTVRVVTNTATAVTVGIGIDMAVGGSLATYLATVPYVGATLAAIVGGGVTALVTLAGAAIFGAAISLFNQHGKASLAALVKPAWRFVKGESVVTYQEADGTVVVENAASVQEATELAVQHVKENISEMEALVRGHGRRR